MYDSNEIKKKKSHPIFLPSKMDPTDSGIESEQESELSLDSFMARSSIPQILRTCHVPRCYYGRTSGWAAITIEVMNHLYFSTLCLGALVFYVALWDLGWALTGEDNMMITCQGCLILKKIADLSKLLHAPVEG